MSRKIIFCISIIQIHDVRKKWKLSMKLHCFNLIYIHIYHKSLLHNLIEENWFIIHMYQTQSFIYSCWLIIWTNLIVIFSISLFTINSKQYTYDNFHNLIVPHLRLEWMTRGTSETCRNHSKILIESHSYRFCSWTLPH